MKRSNFRKDWLRLLVLTPLLAIAAASAEQPGQALELDARCRRPAGERNGEYRVVETRLSWAPRQTAIIVCDMWDQHWCKGASERVAEMAPVMNRVINEARSRGVLIIHAPSGTMDSYNNTAQRKRAQQAPRAEPPVKIGGWQSLDLSDESPLPIDDADGGCDCDPKCKSGHPWTKQIDALEIMPQDAVTDNGQEAFNLLQENGIQNVIIMGVHANMCVLGRPFGIRQLVRLGKNVVLMRDMTDTMYNSRQRPFVSHFRGTDLVVEHIEKHWCPTITSSAFTSQPTFRFRADKRPTIVFVIAEQEYDAKLTLPEFARSELEFRFGFKCVVLQSDATDNIPGLEKLAEADLAVFYIRRRTLPLAQMSAIRAYLDSGRPLVALRTSSHAFQNWLSFDAEVLGGNYTGHYGREQTGTTPAFVRVVPDNAGHPILAGVTKEAFPVHSWLYKVSPLASGAIPLMTGRIDDRTPPEPVAWIHSYKGARVFYTSLGHRDDFQLKPFRLLLLNAILWSLDMPIRPVEQNNAMLLQPVMLADN